MAGFKYELGAVVKLNDRRGTVAKVVDRIAGECNVYILETAEQMRYEMFETDIVGLA